MENENSSMTKDGVILVIQNWASKTDGPTAHESFTLIEGNDAQDTVVWVCYWTDQAQQASSLENLSLASIYHDLAPGTRDMIGLWQESFETEVSRLETN